MTGSISDLDNCLDPTRDDREFQRPPPPLDDAFDSISTSSSSSDSSSKSLISENMKLLDNVVNRYLIQIMSRFKKKFITHKGVNKTHFII